jgi:threonine-phosphate decarboxylase
LVKEQRSLLTDGLRQIKGLKVYPGQANFVLVSSRETGMTASELQARLGPRGIIIRDCSNFYHLSDCHFRVAVRSGEENVSLLRIIREVLN